MTNELQGLVNAWLSYHRELEAHGSPENVGGVGEQYFDSIDHLDHLVGANPEQGWEAIQRIFALTENDFQRACLAAGLLEDLLVKHGRDFVERVERLAGSNAEFRELLGGVWRSAIEDAVWLRLQEALRGGVH